MGDIARLRQVLVNLIGNAVKFTKSGSVRIILDSSRLEDGGLMLHFSVEDTGIGIPTDGMDQLFKSFSQLDASITKRYGGTGLGLAISKKLVEMMGGSIWVESVVGHGSTFHFTVKATEVPVGVSEQSNPPSDAVTSAKLRINRPKMSDIKVLLVDDDPVSRKILMKMLSFFGYQADAVSSGALAVAAIMEQKYDVVLMDLNMPGMDGSTACAKIRASVVDQPIVIAITAHAQDEARILAKAAGMDGYLTKPVSSGEIEEVMKRAVAKMRETSGKREGTTDRCSDLLSFIVELRAAALDYDPQALEAAVKSLKDANAKLSDEAFRLCRKLELMGRTGMLEGADELVEMLEHEICLASTDHRSTE
jgi:CheY-like chemotaxis protein